VAPHHGIRRAQRTDGQGINFQPSLGDPRIAIPTAAEAQVPVVTELVRAEQRRHPAMIAYACRKSTARLTTAARGLAVSL
jgi:hypothetical protein